MKLPLNWIKEYTNIDVSLKDYMHKMIMCGTAIESFENAAEFDNVVVGRVLKVEPHTNSDHLHICTVDVGNEDVLQIVCGAPNVRENILVPVAKCGATLPGGYKIKKGKLRGVESFGMICSGPELNVPNYLYPSVGDAGILIFNEKYELGTDVKEVFKLDDNIIEFDILANRPDCLSVLGIARESSAVLNTKFSRKNLSIERDSDDINKYIGVEVLDSNACPRYMARVIKDVKITQSPLWLRAHLHKAGVRAINNIVDITNFVMLETGHPMHAFDLDKVNGRKIIVRYANESEKIKTLDDKEHILKDTDLLICDKAGPTGIAGIMGGYESEINIDTKNVVFECACFDKFVTRRTSRSLGIRTESSGRFEKGVSVHTIPYAINRACQLVALLEAGSVVSGTIDIHKDLTAQKTIHTSVEYINKRTGVDIPAKDIVKILESLNFTTALSNDMLCVKVPTFRLDVEQEADICEEVLRLYGFDHIPSNPLRGETTQGGLSPLMKFKNSIETKLQGFGFMQTFRYSFIGQKMLNKLELTKNDARMNCIKLKNPLGEDTALMRTSLVPDMLQNISTNISKGNNECRFYENSVVFFSIPTTEEGLPSEYNYLCLSACGQNEDFYSLRSVCEAIISNLGIDYTIVRGGDNYYHSGKVAKIIAENVCLAQIGEINGDVASNFDINIPVYIAELDIDELMKLSKAYTEVKELPKFPPVTRDLAIVFNESVEIGPVIEDMKLSCGKNLESITMFDVYRGKPIAEGFKSVAFSLIFRNSFRTLTDDEVQTSINACIKLLNDKYNANIR